MKPRIVIIALLVLAGISAHLRAQPSATLSLKQCVDRAIAFNATVQQQNLSAQTSQVQLQQSKGNVLPDLFANINHGLNKGRSIDPFTNSYVNQSLAFGGYSLSSQVVLYGGATLQNTIQQNKLNYQATTMDAAQARDNVTLSVIVAYLQILTNVDLVKQAMAQAVVTRQQVDRLAILNKEGAIQPAQYYDLKGQLANDELSIVNGQNALDQARLTLCQLMNIPYNKNLAVQPLSSQEIDDVEPGTAGEIYQYALSSLPMIKSVNLRQQSATKGLQVARGNFLPVVSLGGSINTNYSNAARVQNFVNSAEVPSGDFIKLNGSNLPVFTTRNNFASQGISYGSQFKNNYNASVYLNVNIPILNGFRAKNAMARARIDKKTAEVSSEAAKNQLNQLVEQACFNRTAATEKVNTLQRQVADFSESFRTAQVRFNAGVITQVDYLVAKNNMDRANINLIIAQYDYIIRNKIVEYYEGKLQP